MRRSLIAAALGALALGGCATYGYDTYGYDTYPSYGYGSSYNAPYYGYNTPYYGSGYYYDAPGVVVAPSVTYGYWGRDRDDHRDWRDREGRGNDHRGNWDRDGRDGRDRDVRPGPNWQPGPNASTDRQRQNAWDRGEYRQLPQESRGGEAGM